MAKKPKTPSVADLRIMLKGAGVKGNISKWNKKKLLQEKAALLKQAAQSDPSSNAMVGGPSPSINPEGEAQLQPSHGDGSSNAVTGGAAPNIPPKGDGISLAPVKGAGKAAPLEIKGEGTKHGNTGFRAFVKAHAKDPKYKGKGSFKKLAAAYREQSGKGHEQDGAGNAHDKFMDATDDYCEQKGDGLMQAQMNGAGRSEEDPDSTAHEDAHSALRYENDPEANRQDGGAKRTAAEKEEDEDAVQGWSDAVDAAQDRVDGAERTIQMKRRRVDRAQQRHDAARQRESEFMARVDEVDEPGAWLDTVDRAHQEDLLQYQTGQSADSVHLFSQDLQGAEEAFAAARAALQSAQQAFSSMRERVARAEAEDDAEDRNPQQATQMNAEPRSRHSFIDDTTSDDEDLLAMPFEQDPDSYDVASYLKGGSFWKDAAGATGTALTTAALPLAGMPVPGARVAALGALGVGSALRGAQSVMD